MSGLCPSIEPYPIVCEVTIKVTVKFITFTKKIITTLSLQLPKKSNVVSSDITKKVTCNELLPFPNYIY